jgi:hypothetical protein
LPTSTWSSPVPPTDPRRVADMPGNPEQ